MEEGTRVGSFFFLWQREGLRLPGCRAAWRRVPGRRALSRDARYRASESTRISIEAPDHWLIARLSVRSRRPA